MGFEFIEIIVEREESDDKLFDLNSALKSAAVLEIVEQKIIPGGRVVLLQVLESILQEICDVFLQELLVGGSKRGLLRGIDRLLQFSRFDEVKHARQEHCL